ncbi:MAG TPA: M12 family metallo-peptidase [Blastocatellia bacterium]|nr:M12 family metallo-peptidase [Blastocatellia bacterium]
MKRHKKPEPARAQGKNRVTQAAIIRAALALILVVFAIIISLLPIRNGNVSASPSAPADLWERVDGQDLLRDASASQSLPGSFKAARLNRDALSRLLEQAPMEFTDAAKDKRVVLSVPMPDGSFARFRIEESPVMEPGLAAQFPEIRTYRGQGLDDPTATARFDLTPKGFHGYILSSSNTVYTDPMSDGGSDIYISYNKREFPKEATDFQCLVTDADEVLRVPEVDGSLDLISGATLRTYRLALAATGEYTAAAGGTVAAATARMATTMNRVNGVYERDLSVRLILVANNASIVFTNSASDPYSNNNGSAMLGQNQTTCDNVIGSANYDVGHVFSTGGGGVASVGVPCITSFKARGVTGLPNPTGDVFAIDFVAHEMGHQFGARHTFNGSVGNCAGGNRSATAAYEPGSGSTIMAYAGICGSQDIQDNSNDYFHHRSLEEINAVLESTGGTCATTAATGNTPPTVTVGSAVTIPARTPFALTATGSDANGDAVTYCWEEYDLGPASPPDADSDGQARPIFRSFNPTASSTRTFPQMTDLLNNVSTYGESLPNINRVMNFRVTARDNRSGSGAINSASTQVAVFNTGIPFLVVTPNTVVSWGAGSSQTVTWEVAGTAGAPISAADVKISLSTDGGNTFPTVLAASTPNDGSHVITVPNSPTNMARVKVEAVGNIFFDISNTNFTITGAAFNADTTGVFRSSNGALFLKNTNASGFADILLTYGIPGDIAVAGDWNGDGIDTIGVYRNGDFLLRNSNTNGFADIVVTFGAPGDLPIVGDWNGDGTDTIGIYRNGTFLLRNSNTPGDPEIVFSLGVTGDVPISGDWDGNGTVTTGVFRPANGALFLKNTNATGFADILLTYGVPGDKPVTGDWNGDGTDTIGVYRNGDFLLRNSNTNGFADIVFTLGVGGDSPIAGDWDNLQ